MTARSAVAARTGSSVGPTAEDERTAGGAGAHDRDLLDRPRLGVRLSAQAHVGAAVAGELAAQELLDLVRRGPGTWIANPGTVASSATSPGAWCVRPSARGVVGRADADQHRADVLVAEVELDLLERALDEERRVAVDDRAHALLRQAGGDADHQLLADADVDHALGVPVPGAGLLEGVDADVGQHERQPRVVVERLAR